MQRLKMVLLQTAMTSLNRMAETSVAPSKADVTLAGAHRRMGELLLELGQTEQALSQFQRCHEIVEELNRQGQLQHVEQNFATSLNNLGEATLRLGDLEGAQRHFLRALEQRKQWLENNKHDKRLAFWVPVEHISDSHYRLGKLALKKGDPQTALDHHIQVRDVRAFWVKTYPTSLKAKLQLAGAHADLGDVYRQLGKFEKARDSLRLALAFFEPQAKRNTKIVSARGNLAVTLDKLADVSLWFKDFPAARKYYEQAKELFEQLSAEDPLNARLKRDLALVYTGLGTALHGLEDPEAASGFHKKALELQQRLFEEDPKDVRAQAELMQAYARVGLHTKAAEIADRLKERFAADRRILMHVVDGYSLCVSAVAKGKKDGQLSNDDRQLQREFGNQAIEVLQKCIDLGCKSWASIESDPDLDPIRDRKGFTRLLNDLKQAEKPTDTNRE